MAYGKIKNGVIVYAPDVYESSVITINGFNNDIALMKEFGYKEVVESGCMDDLYITNKVITELDDIISVNYEIDNSKEIVDVIKASKIEKTRANLAEYLEKNPLMSSAKDGVELPYTVTLEKQTQLTATITDFVSNAFPYIIQAMASGLSGKEFVSYMNSLPIDITWNSQGDTCKKWTYSEIFQLKTEMMNYVKPIVEYQRYLEKLITNYQTQEEIISLNIEFTREKIDECIDILWGKPTEEQPPTEEKPGEGEQPTEEQPPAEEKPGEGEQPTEEQPTEEQPPAEEQPPTEEQPTEEQPTEEQPPAEE